MDDEQFVHFCQVGALKAVQEALADGQDVNSRDSDQNSGLMLAICYKKKDVVELLLEHPEIDINVSNQAGLTPLHLACQASDPVLVARLASLPSMASLNSQAVWGETALLGAVARGHLGVVKALARWATVPT